MYRAIISVVVLIDAGDDDTARSLAWQIRDLLDPGQFPHEVRYETDSMVLENEEGVCLKM
ncbi:MAG: hypothetical protein AB7U75_14630 [Hyphomicrobiaceae bacterium]